MVPALLILGNKQFGISSTLRHACAACLPTKVKYFDYNWKASTWSLIMALGIIIGAISQQTSSIPQSQYPYLQKLLMILKPWELMIFLS